MVTVGILVRGRHWNLLPTWVSSIPEFERINSQLLTLRGSLVSQTWTNKIVLEPMGDPGQTSTASASASAPQGSPTDHGTDESHVGDTYQVPTYEEHSSFTALKDRIRHHYELASDYYYSLW